MHNLKKDMYGPKTDQNTNGGPTGLDWTGTRMVQRGKAAVDKEIFDPVALLRRTISESLIPEVAHRNASNILTRFYFYGDRPF